MKLSKFHPKNLRFNPNGLFRSKDRSNVSRSEPSSSSFGSSSSSDGSYGKHNPKSAAVGHVTPTSVLPGISGDRNAYSELVQAFKMIDRDNDGVVSTSELETLLSRLGPEPPSREELSLMLSEVDRDGDGCISLEELASRMTGTCAGTAEEELREVFEFFDADHDERITAEELLRVFVVIGDEQCTLEDCQRMIASVDRNGDGVVCFEDFSRMMELR